MPPGSARRRQSAAQRSSASTSSTACATLFMKGLRSGGRRPALAAATLAFCPRCCHEAFTRASAPVKYGVPVARTRASSAAECPTAYSSTCAPTSFASNSMPASKNRAVSEHSTG